MHHVCVTYLDQVDNDYRRSISLEKIIKVLGGCRKEWIDDAN